VGICLLFVRYVMKPQSTIEEYAAIFSWQNQTIVDLESKLNRSWVIVFAMPDWIAINTFPLYLKDNKIQSWAKLNSITTNSNWITYTLCNETLECSEYKHYADSDTIPANGSECIKEVKRYDKDCFDTSIVWTEQQIKAQLCIK
jgi:hypothetical protein